MKNIQNKNVSIHCNMVERNLSTLMHPAEYQSYKIFGIFENCGRERKTSGRMDRKIISEAQRNSRITYKEILKAITRVGQVLLISTIGRRLYESGLKCRRPLARVHKDFTID